MELSVLIGRRLNDFLKEKELTITRASIIIETSQSRLSRVVNGIGVPSMSYVNLFNLKTKLGMDLNWLVTGDSDKLETIVSESEVMYSSTDKLDKLDKLRLALDTIEAQKKYITILEKQLNI